MRRVLGVFLVVATVSSAQAQSVSLVEQRARAHFEQGLARLRAGQAAEGRDLLRRALAILPTVATQYNLALALRRTGEPTEAEYHLRQLLTSDELSDAQRARVEAQLALLEGELAILAITLTEGARVEVDGFAVGRAEPRIPLRVRVDPGRHSVSAFAGTRRGLSEVELERGEERRLSLTLAPFVATRRWWPWVVAIGGLLLAGGITTAVLLRRRDQGPYAAARRYETLSISGVSF
ncbi:MAG: hypothetical protein AAGE52_25005 [Myxococcota bacterium]